MGSMTFQEALDYVWSLVNFETRPPETREPYSLDRFRGFVRRLDNPHERFASVHIAGSKGKGSTSSMIEAVLRAAGYRVGFYSSPHLHTPRERIRIDGRMISEEDFIVLVERLRPVADAIGDVTTFEFLTAMSFVYFAEQDVEIAVVEVGLGGRLDATNVVQPLVSVITPLSLEHTRVLGSTIEEIAAEKGGIIKPGVPLVSAPQPLTALEVLARLAAERGAPTALVGLNWTSTRTALTLDGQHFDVEFRPRRGPPPGGRRGAATWGEACAMVPFGYRSTDLCIPLLGAHQIVNATTALAALELLQRRGFLTDEAALRRGLATVTWPARVEVLNRRPLVVADGAHSDASALALAETLRELRAAGLVAWQRLWLIFGALIDKNLAAVIGPLLPLADELILTSARHPRALSPDELTRRLSAADLTVPPVHLAATVEEALALAWSQLRPDDAVIMTGSLSVAAEGRMAWRERQADPGPIVRSH